MEKSYEWTAPAHCEHRKRQVALDRGHSARGRHGDCGRRGGGVLYAVQEPPPRQRGEANNNTCLTPDCGREAPLRRRRRRPAAAAAATEAAPAAATTTAPAAAPAADAGRPAATRAPRPAARRPARRTAGAASSAAALRSAARRAQVNVTVWPHLLMPEFLATALLTVGLIVMSWFINAPLEEHSNPNRTPNPSQGALVLHEPARVAPAHASGGWRA